MHLYLNEDGQESGRFEDGLGLVQGECAYNQESHTWGVRLTNTLNENNILRSADIHVIDWKRGRFDTYRDGEISAKGRAFGSMIHIDILPGEELFLHIRQDERVKASQPVVTYGPSPAQEVDARAKLAELQAQINDIAGQLNGGN